MVGGALGGASAPPARPNADHAADSEPIGPICGGGKSVWEGPRRGKEGAQSVSPIPQPQSRGAGREGDVRKWRKITTRGTDKAEITAHAPHAVTTGAAPPC